MAFGDKVSNPSEVSNKYETHDLEAESEAEVIHEKVSEDVASLQESQDDLLQKADPPASKPPSEKEAWQPPVDQPESVK